MVFLSLLAAGALFEAAVITAVTAKSFSPSAPPKMSVAMKAVWSALQIAALAGCILLDCFNSLHIISAVCAAAVAMQIIYRYAVGQKAKWNKGIASLLSIFKAALVTFVSVAALEDDVFFGIFTIATFALSICVCAAEIFCLRERKETASLLTENAAL